MDEARFRRVRIRRRPFRRGPDRRVVHLACSPHAWDASVRVTLFKYEKGRSNRYGALWHKVRERFDR